MSQRTFQFHQTLHGYNDGHRLLRASRKLPPDVERLMLIMSDMSGGSMVHGFESYLTGYPLKEIKAYALARTWYAPEMRRPGCVWTHTLLVQNTDLAYVTDFRDLLDLFVRPSHNVTRWEPYSSPLTCVLDETPRRSLLLNKSEWRELAQSVLESLYGSPQAQVFLPLEQASTEYEELTLALWSQQWARLRRVFKFCTGAIADRKLPDGVFDWQIIPRSSEREIELEIPNAIFARPGSKTGVAAQSAWVEIALSDLGASGQTYLRRFLRTFGVEALEGRANYAPLVQTFAALVEVRRGAQPLDQLIEAVAHLFPSPREGARMKTYIFGSTVVALDKPLLFPHNRDEAEVLQELARTKHHTAFNVEALQVGGRAAALAKHDFSRASAISYSLLSTELTPLGDRFIDGFCEGITTAEVFDLPYDQIDLVFPLLERKPMLAASPNLWRGSGHEQRRIFDFVHKRANLSQEGIGHIIAAMLKSNSDAVAEDVAAVYPLMAVETVLSWCDSLSIDEVFNLGANWKRVLANQPQLCITWLKSRNTPPSEATMVLLAGILDPHSQTVLHGGAGVWVRLAQRAPELLQGNVLTTAMTFLLVLGFNNPEKEAVLLVIDAFEPVHKAAEENRLNYARWRLLASKDPSVSWDGDWDKCGRLRIALIEHFIRYRWPYEDLLRCLKNPDLLWKVVAQVLEQGWWFNRRRNYLEKVAKKVLSGEIEATKPQRDILAANFCQ